MTRFTAGVQYNDWKGTAAADDADMRAISTYMREAGLIGNDDHVEAVSLYTGEHGFVSIRAFVVTADQAAAFRQAIEADALVPVKEVDIEADVATFLSLFKRFNVMISRRGELDGREIDADD